MCNYFDVIVIGSGPSGSMAAIEASKKGLRVAMLEKEKLPRRKVCAGGLTKRAVELIPSDIKYPVQNYCSAIELHVSGTGMKFKRQLGDKLVSMVCRRAFDYALVEHAVKLGVEVMDDSLVQEIIPHNADVEIKTDKGAFKCGYLIFAEGATARLSNQFWQDDRKLIPSIEADVYLPAEQLESLRETVQFDFGAIQGGYGWVFPKDNHLSVGLGSFGGETVRLQKQFDAYLKELGIFDSGEILNRKGFIIPVTPRKGPFVKGRMLLVGDAAGFVDPITAEGLLHAIRSGQEAGRSIAAGFAEPSHVEKLYHQAIQEPILNELSIAKKIAKVIYSPNTKWRDLLLKHYGDRFCRGMKELIEGERTYASSMGSKKVVMRTLKFFMTKG